MRKLSLDDTWDYTKLMWKWIAFRKEVLKDERSVYELKKAWLKENTPEYSHIQDKCFFCEASTLGCTGCPGRAVDPKFNCNTLNSSYHFYDRPGAFYREILRLDAIRTAKPVEPVVPTVPEHKWVHGDVFSNHVFPAQMCAEREHKLICVNLLNSNSGGDLEFQTRPAAEPKFLFNIKDKL